MQLIARHRVDANIPAVAFGVKRTRPLHRVGLFLRYQPCRIIDCCAQTRAAQLCERPEGCTEVWLGRWSWHLH